MVDFQKRGRDYEKLSSEDYGGKRQPGSGNHWSAKADFRWNKFLFEVKFCSKEDYTLEKEDLNKVTDYALRKGLIPVFQLGFYGGLEVVILNECDYEYITSKQDQFLDVETRGTKTFTLNKWFLEDNQRPPIRLAFGEDKYIIMPKKIFKILADNFTDE